MRGKREREKKLRFCGEKVSRNLKLLFSLLFDYVMLFCNRFHVGLYSCTGLSGCVKIYSDDLEKKRLRYLFKYLVMVKWLQHSQRGQQYFHQSVLHEPKQSFSTNTSIPDDPVASYLDYPLVLQPHLIGNLSKTSLITHKDVWVVGKKRERTGREF